MPIPVKEPPVKNASPKKEEPKGSLLDPRQGKGMMDMVNGSSKKSNNPLDLLGGKQKKEGEKKQGEKKEKEGGGLQDKNPGDKQAGEIKEKGQTLSGLEKESKEKGKKTDVNEQQPGGEKKDIDSSKQDVPEVQQKTLSADKKHPEFTKNTPGPKTQEKQGQKKVAAKAAGTQVKTTAKNKRSAQSKTSVSKTVSTKTTPETKGSSTVISTPQNNLQGTGDNTTTGTGDELVNNPEQKQDKLAETNPDLLKKPGGENKDVQVQEIKPVKQPVKAKSGIKHDKRTFNVAGELAKLKKEKTRVKTGIDTSGKANIKLIKDDVVNEKARIVADLKAKSETGSALFDRAIGRIQLAVLNAKSGVKKHRSDTNTRIDTDYNTEVAALDKATTDKQAEAIGKGEEFAKKSEDFGTELTKKVKDKTYEQTSANTTNAEKIADKYKKDERHERIKADLADMANRANEPMMEEQGELVDSIKENTDDMAEEFRDSAEDLSDDLPDTKGDVEDKLEELKDKALAEVESADTTALDGLQKNSDEVIVYLKQQKVSYIKHLKSTANDANTALDAKEKDAEAGINKYLTDTDNSLESIITDTETETSHLPGNLALQYIKNSMASVKGAEKHDKDTSPKTVQTTRDDIQGISKKATDEFLNSYNTLVKPLEDTAAGLEQKAKQTSDNITKAYDQSANRSLQGMKDAIKEYSDGLDKAIKEAADGWQEKLDEGKKELQDKSDEISKDNDTVVSTLFVKMYIEAVQMQQEWEATYWVRRGMEWIIDGLATLAGWILWLLKWVLIIVGAIIALIALIILIILSLPEDIGILIVAVIELIVTIVYEILSFVISVVLEDILGSTLVRLAIFGYFAYEGGGKIYEAFTKPGISGRERLNLFFGGLFDIATAVFSEFKVVKGIFIASEGAKSWEAVLKLLGGDEKLGKTLMAFEKTEGELLALLGKIPGPEIEKLLLKSESLAEIEKGLELVNGNVKMLDSLLLQCDSMGQLKGLLGRVENPAELERLINEAGSGPELEKLLNEFPKKSAAELEKSSVESLKNELKAKEEPGADLEAGTSKHPGKYKDKKIIDAENNLVAKTKAKDGHDVGVDINGEPLVCTYCTLMRRDFAAELAVQGDKEIDAIKADMDIIDKMTDAEKQAEEYAKVEDRLKEYKDKKLQEPKKNVNLGGQTLIQVEYGSTDLSKMVLEKRQALGGLEGKAMHNYAVVEYKTADGSYKTIMKHSMGPELHSEIILDKELTSLGIDPKNVTRLYTERSPCTGCISTVQKYTNAEISYTVKWGIEGSNKILRDLYKVLIK
jgi:hypothetical protein